MLSGLPCRACGPKTNRSAYLSWLRSLSGSNECRECLECPKRPSSQAVAPPLLTVLCLKAIIYARLVDDLSPAKMSDPAANVAPLALGMFTTPAPEA
jgi:hypothetical protein